jgi:hypothetical protein
MMVYREIRLMSRCVVCVFGDGEVWEVDQMRD